MSKLDTKEFAAAIKKPIGTVRSHISRGKLERDANGYIDTELEKNRRYIHEHTKGKGLYNVETPPDTKDTTNTEETAKKKIAFHDKRTPGQKKRDAALDDIEMRTKRAALEKSEFDAELKKLEIEKRAGKLLPIELFQKIMTINIQSIFRNFDAESDRIAGIFTEVFGGGREELAEIKKRMRESLGKAIDKAKEDSAAEIEQAIDEYAETRSRGERK